MATVTVTLDNTVIPPNLKFDPPIVDIPPKSKRKIRWVRNGTNFKFAALVFTKPNPISSVVVQYDQISADDDNQQARVHSYAVVFQYRETLYISRPASMSGGGPTIRNN
jgi:hypothetical protein